MAGGEGAAAINQSLIDADLGVVIWMSHAYIRDSMGTLRPGIFDEDPSKGSKIIAIPADYNPISRT